MSRGFALLLFAWCMMPCIGMAMERGWHPRGGLDIRSKTRGDRHEAMLYVGSDFRGRYDLLKNSKNPDEVFLDAFWATPANRSLVWVHMMKAVQEMQAKRLAVRGSTANEMVHFYNHHRHLFGKDCSIEVCAG